jgi:hypothetical protein
MRRGEGRLARASKAGHRLLPLAPTGGRDAVDGVKQVVVLAIRRSASLEAVRARGE